MVKFSRQLEAQLIPEWKEKFVNYRQLKKNVKKIKFSRPSTINAHSSVEDGTAAAISSVFDPIRNVIFGRRHRHRHHPSSEQMVDDEEQNYELEHIHSREYEVKLFFEKLDEELEKVNNFYEAKEAEFVERGKVLNKQLMILTDLKKLFHDRRRLRRLIGSDNSRRSSRSRSSSPCNFSSESATDNDEAMTISEMPSRTHELVAALERSGMTFINTMSKSKEIKGGNLRTTSMRIDIPAMTPTTTVTSWMDPGNTSNSIKKEDGDSITRKKIQCAEKMIRDAFIELYNGLQLLETYSSLNMVAFRKILKKFDKVSDREESGSYLRMVRRSRFASSDKVVRLGDEVECVFTKHFTNNDRKKAMKFLRPHQPKNSHTITFFVGLFTGSFVTLFSVYAILAHVSDVFIGSGGSSSSSTAYKDALYPIFSVVALLSLHIFLYGCNIYAWRSTRINHNFIFEFSPNTALKHRDAFLISAGLMTVVVGAMVAHLLLVSAEISPRYLDSVPGILLMVFAGLLFCPFKVCYRSTRFCFLRVLRNIILSPFYRVSLVDFFMADQLTSQIPLTRHMEFTACFFMAGGSKNYSFETCSSRQYKLVAYIISFLPYYWRTMQCVRRYMEEGYDMNHMANAGKYISAMVAAAARMKYAIEPTSFWLGLVIMASSVATAYQLYWDFVKDWGFLHRNCGNPFLRDELILKNRTIYYFSITFNFVLRLAWIESITHINLGRIENRMVDFLLASLEIIRRGHWNYYRLENEHLNNVGKFRAVNIVPLPLRGMDSE